MSKNSRKNAKTKRIIAGFLSIILIITMIFPAYPIKAVENDATIYLSTPEDLIDLSKNCVYDTYADGKRVVLKNDLDMTGYELEPLAIFGGTFEGNNYSIKGLSFQNVGSNKGLFGVIKESGMISNLCVEVWIEPTGSKSNLGGIAGTNQGKIYNCIVNGKIKGEETVGGIVGNNTQTGLISGCSNYAKITGNQYNGGIAGKNYGSIFNCTNYATVNEEENAKAQDTGGIAGISYGEIEQCVNEADIGYLHTGYNVGGIVGRQNGHVMDSVNHGNIYGRKDVGGIVGQFEPYTTIVYEEDIFQEMERKVTEVTDRMNEVLNEAEVALQEIEDCADTIGTEVTNVADTIEREVTSISESANNTLDNVNDTINNANHTITTINNDIEDLTNQAQDILNNLDITITGLTDELFNTIDRANDVIDDVDNMTDDLQDIINDVERTVTDARKRYKEFTKYMDDLRDEIDNIFITLEQYQKQLQEILQKIIDWMATLPSIPDELPTPSVELPDLSTLPSIDLEIPTSTQDSETTEIQEESSSELTESETIVPTETQIESTIETETIIEPETEPSTQADTSIEYSSPAEENTASIAPVSSLRVGVSLDNLNLFTDDNKNSDTRVDLEEIEEETEKNGLLEEKVVDASSNNDSYDISLVRGCLNTGEINADGNVGGIAGIIAQEIGTNPEEDIVFIGKESLKSTAYIKANIESCNNQGSVKAKNSYAGGIVGRADMGTLRDDKNTGTVETTNGSFNGGIAGSSNGLITSCYAISDLIGNDDMGGIAGKACDIDHSYSMVRITSEGERIGAIAGSVSGIASQNFFVKENLQGVNGINYEGSAMPLEYQDFITSSNLPEEFKKLKVCFYTDNTLLKTVFVDYEGSIAQEDIPTIPDKDGLFAKWEDFDHNSIIRNINVHAVYSNWTSTISTGEEKPKLLLEGEFHPNTTITLTDIMQEEVGIEIPEGYSLSEAYSFLVHSPIEHKNDKIKVHILSDLEEKSAKIGMLTENGLILRNCEKEGSYLIFDMEDIGEFLILEKKTNPLPFLFIACAGAIGVGIIVRIIYKKKRKKK
ncbi:MAG: apolipoprotein A1/A4/E family protein [Lachnospiraceae bacterium]|jgi:prefoldin subunit 5|nr:apolipoprotein A1/A4/E family protein [Lachnospiraceae bacterium]